MIKKIISHPSLLIILLTLLPALLLMALLSSDPALSFDSFFTGPFSNSYIFGNMLNRATPLFLTSLGAFIAFKSNSFNLGGEGQVYLGATICGIMLNSLSVEPSPLVLCIAIIVAVGATGFLALISAVLEHRYHVDTLITSYLLSMATIHVCDYFVTGPYLKEGSNILTTEGIDKAYWLERILPPSSLSTGFIIAVATVILAAFILRNTIWGYEFTIAGRNHIFSRSMGINSKLYQTIGLTLSGMLHGLAGVLIVIGSYHAVITDFYSNLGWSGLSSALLAGSRPIFVIISSLFYAYLDTGSSYATITSDLTIEISAIIKSVLFFVISSAIIKEHIIKRSIK